MMHKIIKLLVIIGLGFNLVACSSSEAKEENVVQDKTVNTEESTVSKETDDSLFDGYRVISVDGGDLSGEREANVAVDIGYGDREYWAFTNEYGQLVKVVADEIVLQSDDEPLTSSGRYYNDEAKVPGVEQKDLDEGHVIADSLGGVSNAYNITPQNSTLNRYGDQAYMEKVIRDAGGCQNFVAVMTYANTKTQIPESYQYTYTVKGHMVTDSFPNENPEKQTQTTTKSSSSNKSTTSHKQSHTTNKDDHIGHEVWLSETGSKYHSRNDCGRMNPSKARQVSLSFAKQQGYEACQKCW